MQRAFCILILLFLSAPSYGRALSIACGTTGGVLRCAVGYDLTMEQAKARALNACARSGAQDCSIRVGTDESAPLPCVSVASTPDGKAMLFSGAGTPTESAQKAINLCGAAAAPRTCGNAATSCLPMDADAPFNVYTSMEPVATDIASGLATKPHQPPPRSRDFSTGDIPYINAIVSGVLFGLGVIVALLTYAKRQSITNWIVHGGLPYKSTLPGSDIQVSFTKKQRVNWYGRVVFGFVMQIALTDKQLGLIRRYWLGRIVAFDSLRRQRQNELARLHFQLAKAAQPTPKDDQLLSRMFACLRRLVFFFFWAFRAVISLFIGFLFIRVTVAKLVRGTIIESKNLLLLMEAREAVESSALYLKQYLELAETFDGRQDVYEPK